MKSMLLWAQVFIALVLSFSVSANDVKTIWPSIPFVRGADLCQYQDAFGKSRSEYIAEMVGNAKGLMQAGAKGSEALQMLVAFDSLYDKNKRLALKGKYLDVTLENTLKAFFDDYYRKLRPRTKKLVFRHVNDISTILNTAKKGQRIGYVPQDKFDYLDYFAYGSYAMGPNCDGSIVVTLTLIGRDGETLSYQGRGPVHTVMSKIASRMFEDFQRTKFPSTVRLGNRQLTIVGGLNGSVDKVRDAESARWDCESLDARLPNARELERISNYGDWSGGVSIGRSVWAIQQGRNSRVQVFHPGLRNPSPVRDVQNVNEREFNYYCVR